MTGEGLRQELGESGYMNPRRTVLSGVWNLMVQVEHMAAIDAEDEVPPLVYWEELTHTEQMVFEEQFVDSLAMMAEHAARVAMIHKEHKDK